MLVVSNRLSAVMAVAARGDVSVGDRRKRGYSPVTSGSRRNVAQNPGESRKSGRESHTLDNVARERLCYPFSSSRFPSLSLVHSRKTSIAIASERERTTRSYPSTPRSAEYRVAVARDERRRGGRNAHLQDADERGLAATNVRHEIRDRPADSPRSLTRPPREVLRTSSSSSSSCTHAGHSR